MDTVSTTSPIPCRAQTLDVLRHIRVCRPILMLRGSDDGYGTRWLLDGMQVQPVIAEYLMNGGFLADSSATGFGARILTLTDSGQRLRENGLLWWDSLGYLERWRIRIFG